LHGKSYQISTLPDPKQRKVFPDSFQVILNQYLHKAEIKSLAPNGTECKSETEGVLRRAEIESRSIIPVGKETDRHWEQGEDPSMLETEIQTFGHSGKLVVADESERQEWSKIGKRRLMRATNLTQLPIYRMLSERGVRPQTMAIFRAGVSSLGA